MRRRLSSFTYKTVYMKQMTADGHIECRASEHEEAPSMCSHINDLIESGDDADYIWTDLLDLDLEDSPVRVQVPMYFAASNDWSAVFADCEITKMNSVLFGLYYLDQNPWRRREEVFVGFTCEGEGRKVWKQMLYNWLVSDEDFGKECSSGRHGLAEQRMWNHSLGTEEEMYQRWSIFTTASCLGCRAKSNPSGRAFNDDLIPEGGSGWKNTLTTGPSSTSAQSAESAHDEIF